MKIAVGTTSKQKIEYLKEVLDDIGIQAEILPTDVSSKISEQPKTIRETKLGSKNRAQAAFDKNPGADFAVGIEIGYHQNRKGKYEMFCCASIVDSHDFFEACLSSKFLLPKFHQEVLQKNKYLGEHVREYKKNIDSPVTNYIRRLITERKPLIFEATRNVLLRYLNKEDFC